MFSKKPKARKVDSLAEIDELSRSGKPVLVDFYQVGCAPCQVMDGIMNELARDYGSTAHVVKADIRRMQEAVERFTIRATPTMVLLARPPARTTKKAKARTKGTHKRRSTVTQRGLAPGLVPQDQLSRLLESNGARRATAG